MGEIINENTIVTLYQVEMDYVYRWGLEVPIVNALSEISKMQKEEPTSTYHICIGNPATKRICSIANYNVRFDEDRCLPDVQTVSDLLTQNGTFEFNILNETWSLKKTLIYSGLPEEKIDKLLHQNEDN